jgi:hypothetical protein
MSKSSHRNEAGQAILLVTIGLVFIFGILGLVVDVGYSYYLKQVAQAAVDSAVTAAATMANSNGGTCGTSVLCQQNVSCSSDPANPPVTDFDTACLYAKANGFKSTGNQQVTISGGTGNPPTVSGLTANYWVSATATQTTPLSFLQVLGFTTSSVTARATGALIGNSFGGCIYVLDPVGSAAFNAVGTSNVTSNCGIWVNSSASDALTAKGGAQIQSSVVNVVGGTKVTGGAKVTPTPTTGASPTSDPLASLPAPNYSGCDQTNLHLTGGINSLSPGVYCGGIQASGQAVLNFAPGTYVLNGGGMSISSANVSLNGSGVFFYNTSNGYAFGPVVVVGGANVNLTAPTSGTYRGILLFQDRNLSESATTAFGGSSTETLTGSIYLPNGQLDFAGGSSTNSLTMALIAKDLTIVGNAYLNKDSTGASTGISPSAPALVQ